MKKIVLGLACFLMIFTLTGCKKVSKLKESTDVLVKFEDEKMNITTGELYDLLKEKYGINHLIEMIDKKILDPMYKTDDIANNYLDQQIETYESYYGGEEKLLETIQNAGYQTMDEFRESLLISYKRNLALEAYVKKSITDSEIEKYYNNEMFGDIIASHILIKVDTESASTDEEKKEVEDKALKTIDEILEKLKEGKDFHELAKDYSEDDATKTNGGKLEAFNKGEMQTEFEKAAINLQVGKYTTKAVKTSYGYHLIYKEEQKEKASLKDVRQTIIENLVDEKIKDNDKLQYEALIELRKENGIVINDEELNTYYDNAVNNWLYSKEDK